MMFVNRVLHFAFVVKHALRIILTSNHLRNKKHTDYSMVFFSRIVFSHSSIVKQPTSTVVMLLPYPILNQVYSVCLEKLGMVSDYRA